MSDVFLPGRGDSRPLQIVLPRTSTVTVVKESSVIPTDLDTNGQPVPTNGPHAFTYDDSGNLKTDTVTTPQGTWVRTYTYDQGNQTEDSGWVRL